MRIKLTIAYDGTAYSGFQSQTNALAVQDVLNAALADLFGHPVKTTGASRTDTGVHAKGNVAVFDIETHILPGKIALALNARLPEDIRIIDSCAVADDFHPLRAECVKTYSYRILNRRFPDPMLRLYTLHYYYPLDSGKMNEAARFFIGTHDFAAFCSSGFSGKSTVRTIYRSEVVRDGDLITYTVSGNGFLYNMVRIISGTLINVGSGRTAPEEIPVIIASRDRSLAGDTALAKGLTLEEIRF
ncbi:MAG: tRNA pseudouridine(38-40) synthase TruA [Lachnospiraceae bacterium]|nr:tRNA pseudouridine(38-40) synthase TruA [Lachnospiraceae bacterium]